MKRTDIFERAEDWNARGDKLRLRPGEWMLLESIDGWHTIGEILDEGEWDQPSTEASLEKLLQLGLIRRNEYSWEEYCHRFREDDEEVGETFEAVELAAPAPEAPAAAAVEMTASAPVPAAPTAPTAPEAAPPSIEPVATAPAPEPERAPAERTPPPPAPLQLREVLDFVMDRAGGGPKGQLAVYRTFLKIPMHQLRESGIKSLNVTTADLTITDPALQQSLLQAVASVVGEPYDREPALAAS